MSTATENYVDTLRNDLKRAQETIKHQQATITALQEENYLHELNEARFLDKLKKQSHISTAGNNGDLPEDVR